MNNLSPSLAPFPYSTAPIGIFDSGVGGLSIWQAIRAQLPQESLIYVADSLYAPYGDRSTTFIKERALAIGEWLVEQGVKALVVACNTATLQAVSALREQFSGLASLPIIGVEPAIKSAAQSSKTGVAGVLATTSSLRSEAFARLLARHAGECRFICQAGSGLVAAIERGETDSPALRHRLTTYLQPMLEAQADTLVLGSTHFPFLRDIIDQITGFSLNLIDTGGAVARQLEAQLRLHTLLAPAHSHASLYFYTTAEAQHLQSFLHSPLGLVPEHINVQTLALPKVGWW